MQALLLEQITSKSFDQSLQNSLKHNIAPSAIVKIIEKMSWGRKSYLLLYHNGTKRVSTILKKKFL
jgi:hypothetical protein